MCDAEYQTCYAGFDYRNTTQFNMQKCNAEDNFATRCTGRVRKKQPLQLLLILLVHANFLMEFYTTVKQ